MRNLSLIKRLTAVPGLILISMLAIVSPGSQAVESPDWLRATELGITKTQDLSANKEPSTLGYDCTMVVDKYGASFCEYTTPLGRMTSSGIVAPDGLKIVLDSTEYGMMPVGQNLGQTLLWSWYDKAAGKSRIAISGYDPGKLREEKVWNQILYRYEKRYVYSISPYKTLGNGMNLPIGLDSSMVAFSANGRYMTVPLQKYTDSISGNGTNLIRGILLYDTTTWRGRQIAYTTEINSVSLLHGGANIAVSNDGRFVAINGSTTVDKKPALWVYDTTTCRDLSFFATGTFDNACEHNDVLNGKFRAPANSLVSHSTYSPSLMSMSEVEYPRHLRFTADNGLLFQGVYGRTSPTTFSVAEYHIEPKTTGKAPIAVLGVGDSYISGEGAFSYRVATDVENNKCHTSHVSYPLRLGNKLFPEDQVKTVACSGAKIDDVMNISKSYTGQTTLKVAWQDRSIDIKNWVQQFNFPGYTYQKYFANRDKPRNILLSIGGNDIGFGNIISQCVDLRNRETCYKTKQSREQIMRLAIKTYPQLVELYKGLRKESNGKVYVIAYPQILRLNTYCGANVKLNAQEAKFGSQLITYLNGVIKKATLEAGVQYVDTENAFVGYRLCEAPKGKTAVNGFTVGKDDGATVAGKKFYFIGKESYHPTQFGHELLEKKILQATNNLTTPMPKPTSQIAPVFDPNHELIRNAEDSSENAAQLTWIGYSKGMHILYKGSKYVLPTSKLPTYFKVGTHIKAYLHSTPVLLYEGDFSDGKNIILHIPESVPAGVHSLDIYGVDADGVEINVRQLVYVAHSETDYDGDGVPNEASPCLFVSSAGVDEDADGVDDGCDGVIGAVGAEDTVLPAYDSTPLAPEDAAQSKEDDESALSLEKWVEPTPASPAPTPLPVPIPTEPSLPNLIPDSSPLQPTTPIELSPTQSALIVPLRTVTAETARIEHRVFSTGSSNPLSTAEHVLGEVLAARNMATIEKRTPHPNVMGATQKTKGKPHNNDQHAAFWKTTGLLGVLNLLLLGLILWRRQKRKHSISF